MNSSELLEQAREHRKGGRLEEAALDLEQVLALEPDHDVAMMMLAGLLSDLNERSRAWECASRAIEIRQQSAPERLHQGLINRAIMALRWGHATVAITDLAIGEQALVGKPQHPSALANLASALNLNHQYARALSMCEQGLKELTGSQQDEVLLSLKLNRAEALIGLQQIEEARNQLHDILDSTSNTLWPSRHAQAHLLLGQLRSQANDREQQRRHAILGRRAARLSHERLIERQLIMLQARNPLEPNRIELLRNIVRDESKWGLEDGGMKTQVEALIQLSWAISEQDPQQSQGLLLRANEVQEEIRQAQNNARLEALELEYKIREANVRVEEARNAQTVAEAKVKDQVDQLYMLATRDHLTGLYNRNLFEREVGRHITQLRPDLQADLRASSPVYDSILDSIGTHSKDQFQLSSEFALAVMDLNRFKVINDSMGHDAGDELLRQVAGRLKDALKSGEYLARMGGDEFLMVTSAEGLCERLLDIAALFDENFNISGESVHTEASIGAAIWPTHAATTQSLMRLADHAMYEAKRGMRSTCVHDASHYQGINAMKMEKSLTRAVKHEEFQLIYQPIVDYQKNRVCSVEALMRWTDQGKAVSPGEFIPLIEESGLISKVGRWSIMKAWRELHQTGLMVSVNVSPKQLHAQALDQIVQEGIYEGLDPTKLQLEITESSLTMDAENGAKLLRRLRDMGVCIAIDDFGVGHSNLALLRQLPAQVLKIDRSFSRGLGLGSQDEILVQAMQTMAQGMGMEVVIEGIEETRQALKARAMGIKKAQGWAYHRGSSIEQLSSMLQQANLVVASEISLESSRIDA